MYSVHVRIRTVHVHVTISVVYDQFISLIASFVGFSKQNYKGANG